MVAVESRRAQARQYYWGHREEVARKRREAYAANRQPKLVANKKLASEHQEERKVYNREYGKRWRIENRERIALRQKLYYEGHEKLERERAREEKSRYRAENPDHALVKAKAYREEHRQEINERARQRRAANPEKYRAACRKWRATHPEKAKANTDEWEKENPEKWWALKKKHNLARKARLRGITTEPIDLMAIIDRDKNLCGICHKLVRPEDRSFDHILPLSRGGAHAEYNLQLAHMRCNSRKGAGRIPSQMRLAI